MSAGVVFRRIRGRIVPIAKKVGQAIAARPGDVTINAVFGAAVGVVPGAVATGVQNQDPGKKIEAVIRRGTTDTKKFVKRTGIKNVHVITSGKDVAKLKGLSKGEKSALKSEAHKGGFSAIGDEAFKGNNAFALRYKNKDYIFARAKTSESVVGHELGHIVDYRKNGGHSRGLFGEFFGTTLAAEKRAWDYSPSKSTKGKDAALQTYQNAQRNTRLGVLSGAAAGIWFAIKGSLK